MVDICNITNNNYICAKKDVSSGSSGSSGINTYTIRSEETRIANELMNTNYINFDISKSEISLTANSSNHYFWADDRAHCSEKWQDWFCVPNYHNNNNVKKYPNSKTMSVGVCYTACPTGYTTSGINKCNLYEATNDDLIYNPLAIIALFGTHFYINYPPNYDDLKYYKDIKDTIGIRGSYLNDLYRVNNNNKFITGEYIDVAKNIPIAFPNAPTVVFTGGRAAGADPATAATAKAFVIDKEIKSIRMTSGGSGYTSAPSVSFENVGTGVTDTATATANLDKRVSAVIIAEGAGGSGYTSAPTVDITGGGGSGAYAIATVKNGVISNITVISGGSGYSIAPTVSFSGVGATTATPATATAVIETFVSNVSITKGGSGYTSDTTNQEKLLLNIINKFVNTGRDDATKITKVMNATIRAITADIKTASLNFITTYKIIKIKENEEALNKIYNRIANYKFDINKLDKLYGKDKNGNHKLVNIIAYAYNIMHILLYDTTTNLLVDSKIIDKRMNVLISIISITLGYEKDNKIQRIIKKIFIKAFINCFKVNFDIFDKYMKKHLYQVDVMRIFDKKELYFNDDYFKRCEYQEGYLEKIKETPYEIPYYNNLTFYDHRLLSEYSENTKYIIQILIIFGISLAIVLVVAGVYGCLIQLAIWIYTHRSKRFKILQTFTDFINYVFLFYNSFIFLIVKYTCVLYYFIFCSASKSNITFVYIICNLLNLAFIIFLIGYSFASILELLNIDYVGLLSNIKLTGGGIDIPDVKYNGLFHKVIRYFVILYCIMIYLYCAYLVRYGLNESQYDILSNPDADFNISINYISNILLSQYSTDFLSNINTIYTDEELTTAVNNKDVLEKIKRLEDDLKVKKAAEAQDSMGDAIDTNINSVSGADFGNMLGDGNANKLGDMLGDGNANNVSDMLNQGKGNGNGKVDLNNIDTSKIDLGALANGDTNSIEGQFQGKGKGNGKGNVDLKQLEGNPDIQKAMNNPDMQDAANKFGFNFGK